MYTNEDESFEFYDEIEDIDINEVLAELPGEKKKRIRRKSTDEYYVKGAELIEEIKKYQISKKADAENRGVPFEERTRRNFK